MLNTAISFEDTPPTTFEMSERIAATHAAFPFSSFLRKAKRVLAYALRRAA